MIDVVDALRELLEPNVGGEVTADDTCAQPYEYVADTLYAWVTAHSWISVGTGEANGPSEIEERFAIRVVLALSNSGEEAKLARDRDVSKALDDKAASYLSLIATHAQTPPWDSLSATVDHDFLRQFEVRGIALVVTGWRLRSS